MPDFFTKTKFEAAKQAREILSRSNAVIWDTETTGLRNARIVTIGAINLKGEILLDLLINPEKSIEPGATNVHGISDHDVAGFPAFRHQFDAIWHVLGRAPWIVYNLQYDRPILQKLCIENEHGPDYMTRRDRKLGDYCAMECFAEFYGEWSDYRNSFTWKKLTEACDYLNVTGIDDPAHSAIGDCRRTLAVLQGMNEWLSHQEAKAN